MPNLNSFWEDLEMGQGMSYQLAYNPLMSFLSINPLASFWSIPIT